MSALISVIVPVYNIESYLPQCIDSILSQTYKKLEVILVDDGSPDYCGQICEEFANKDSRIKVIHKKNGGLSSARNAGLDVATGDWISFIDGDDWLEPNMYEVLLDIATKESVDVSCCGINLIYDNEYIDKSGSASIECFDGLDAFSAIINGPLRFEVWNKLFRRSVIGNIRFVLGQTYEDVYFDRMVFGSVKKVAYVDKPLYCYRVARPGSTVSSFKMSRFVIFRELFHTADFLMEKGRNELADLYNRYATETAISFYVDAYKMSCDKEIFDRIIMYFMQSYSRMRSKSLKCQLFKLSPNLYLRLRKICRNG